MRSKSSGGTFVKKSDSTKAILAGMAVCAIAITGVVVAVIKPWKTKTSDETVNSSESATEQTSSKESTKSTETEVTTEESTEKKPLPTEPEGVLARFLGVANYGEEQTKKENAESFQYRFEVDGEEKLFRIDNSLKDAEGNSAFAVQNKLKEKSSYELTLRDDVIVDVEEIPFEPLNYQPPVSGKAGEKTLTNFIKTSMMPIGTTLYVFGGGWDWQDTGSAIQARTLGVSDDWVRFFNQQDVNYTFRDVDNDPDKRDPKTSYYPFGGFNEYYYAGLDCSGFVGWAVYNTFETENGRAGYVGKATKMAKRFSDYGWGSFSRDVKAPSAENLQMFKPGDIMSMKGHVYISLGTCSDGSMLIVHSTNGFVSRTGQPGGGVALGVVSYTKECEAYRLADEYMSKFYPAWYERYSIPVSNPDTFCSLSDSEDTGLFRWDTKSGEGLSDPDHMQDMTPEQVLKFCFGEK